MRNCSSFLYENVSTLLLLHKLLVNLFIEFLFFLMRHVFIVIYYVCRLIILLMIQDKAWNGEDSDEDDDSVDDLEVSDEDSYFTKKAKGRQQVKGGRSVGSTRERASFRASSRQRRVKSSFEEDESSAEDSDSDSEEDFKSMTRRGVNLRKNGGRSTVSTNASGRHSEVRTSSRSVRKVSYVESDGSEEVDEGKKKKLHKVQSTYCSVKSMYSPDIYMYCVLVYMLDLDVFVD
jgi:hypothetical protein